MFELLHAIVEHDGCTLQQAAELLCSISLSGTANPEDIDLIESLLADVYRSGEYCERSKADTLEDIGSKDDYAYQRIGFYRSAIFQRLREYDLDLAEQAETSPQPKPITTPIQAPEPKRWPWGNHHTKALGLLEAAAKHWWVNHDPSDSGTAPRNRDVIDWLINERGATKAQAKSIASILRLDGLPTGPRR